MKMTVVSLNIISNEARTDVHDNSKQTDMHVLRTLKILVKPYLNQEK